MAIQGSSSLMMKICRRLRNEDESARNAIICHARGKEMGFLWTCEQCYERNILPGGCRQFQDNFNGACSACILQGHQRLCSARVLLVEEENYYQPSEGSNDQYRTTDKKRKRTFQNVNIENGEARGKQMKEIKCKKWWGEYILRVDGCLTWWWFDCYLDLIVWHWVWCFMYTGIVGRRLSDNWTRHSIKNMLQLP